MPDDLKKRSPEDPKRINTNQPWEVDEWCRKFGCSKSKLLMAVNVAGPMVDDVEKWLKVH